MNNNTDLSHIIYISSAAEPLAEEDILDIERVAIKRNQEHSLTGLLLFNNGRFMQFLEGPRKQVDKIFHSIIKDERHQDIHVLKNEKIPKRQFSEWHMKRVSIEDIHSNTGLIYNKLFDLDTDTVESVDSAMNSMKLLQNFKNIYSQNSLRYFNTAM